MNSQLLCFKIKILFIVIFFFSLVLRSLIIQFKLDFITVNKVFSFFQCFLCILKLHGYDSYPDRLIILCLKFIMSSYFNLFNSTVLFKVIWKIKFCCFLWDSKYKQSTIFLNVLLNLFFFFSHSFTFYLSLIYYLLKLCLNI